MSILVCNVGLALVLTLRRYHDKWFSAASKTRESREQRSDRPRLFRYVSRRSHRDLRRDLRLLTKANKHASIFQLTSKRTTA